MYLPRRSSLLPTWRKNSTKLNGYIVMAEDGLRAIFEDILGFPDLDSAVFMARNP